MASSGVITNEFLDDFPKTSREGSGNRGRQVTDVDVALEKLAADGAPSLVQRLINYTQDADGNPVDASTASKRAGARVVNLHKRGYNPETGWLIVSRNGSVYAKFYGVGNVPVKETKPVGEQVPV